MTWNPTTGCTKLSPGCKNCYAEKMAHRLKAMGASGYENAFNLTLQINRIEAPLKRKKPTVYFVNSMSDLFHEDIPFSFIDKIFETIVKAHWHTFQILTKRADMFQMIGYDPQYDSNYTRQDRLGFEFDDIAREESIRMLMEQIPKIIYADDNGINYGVLYATTCNESPAHSQIYQESLERLIKIQEIEAISPDGSRRKSGNRIKDTDQIIAPAQRQLFIG